MGWVFNHSPLTGAPFIIHLAIADSVNDLYENVFWMRQSRLATKARCSRSTVASTIHRMLELGLLERVDELEDENFRRSRHEPVRFRFLMPGTETPSTTDVQNLDIGLPGAQDTPETVAALRAFEEFWKVYPRKLDPRSARRKWATVIRAGADPDDIIAGAIRYRDWPGRVPKYTKYPATWLAAGSWENDLAAEPSSNGRSAGNKAVLADAVSKLKERERSRPSNVAPWVDHGPVDDELVIR